MDLLVQRLTNNQFSLDDLLKVSWKKWKDDNHFWSFAEMYDYLLEIKDGQIKLLLDKYILDNEPYVIDH